MFENSLWLFVVAGGPIVIAVAYIIALSRHRRLTTGEKIAQHEAIQDLQHDERPNA